MFSRHGSGSEKRASSRAGGPTQAQLKELRIRARRRLIGALVLVLAAIIIVPWLFQEPVTGQARAPLVVPAAPAGLPPVSSVDGHNESFAAADAISPPHESPATGQIQQPDPASNPQLHADASTLQDTPAAAPASAADADTADMAETKPEPPSTPRPEAAEPNKRTDDGSVALALLAGKSPDKPDAAPESGRYVLQAAAYTTEQDALTRRDSLRQAGVSDAYIEQGQSNGRTVYRLRVGPFGSHQAALAAQTRLRALGYPNSLISSQ